MILSITTNNIQYNYTQHNNTLSSAVKFVGLHVLVSKYDYHQNDFQ
jgi:hypothetical protein